jgi:hypothetical protein
MSHTGLDIKTLTALPMLQQDFDFNADMKDNKYLH